MSTSQKRSLSPKLYFLHGFLGDPEDWNDVMTHLPSYTCQALRYPFPLPLEGILIGYSMGGRIASASPLPKILISAHLGLQTEEEKVARWKQDQMWIRKLESQPLAAFLKDWYEQPLFESLRAHPSFPQILERRMKQDPKQLAVQLREHPLAFQPFQISSQATFFYGSFDKKYKALYERYQVPAQEIINAGHACHLENPLQVAQKIKEVLMNTCSLLGC